MTIKRIIFWEPFVSPHKHYLLEAIAQHQGIEVVCCADQNLSVERRKLGWQMPQAERVKYIISPSTQTIEELVQISARETIHIFSGIRWYRNIVEGLRAVRRNKSTFFIMSEPRVSEGFRGKLRRVHSVLTERSLLKECKGIFAIGGNAPLWYRSIGCPREKIYPFAYFVPPPEGAPETNTESSKETFRLGYVGRMVRAKGVFDLVDGAAQTSRKVRLFFAGVGHDEQALREYCSQQNVDAMFLGAINQRDIGDFFRSVDLICLLSKTTDDGWGVAVSESLMAGTPVIATSFVGASAVLANRNFGKIVNPKDPNFLEEAINELVSQDSFSQASRSLRASIAIDCLSARSGAIRFHSIIENACGSSATAFRPLF